MTYHEYFMQNFPKSNHDTATASSDILPATCYSLCPKEEMEMREKEKLVHILEVVGETKKMVKSYSRSTADKNIALPHLLRPFSVLRETLQYLLFQVVARSEVPLVVRYDFISDRLRSIRQDMTVQRLQDAECLQLLEPMVRFYAYFGYILCEHPIRDFDPVLNRNFLLECLKLFLRNKDSSTYGKVVELDLIGKLMTFNLKEKGLPCDFALMEAVFLLSNLNSAHPIRRYLSFEKMYKSHNILKLAYNMVLAHHMGNYVRVIRLAQQLCPITYCAFLTFLPSLQRHILQIMSHAYSSKQLAVPIQKLQQLLWCDSGVHLQEICTRYGLDVKSGHVRFNKTDFKQDVAMHEPKRLLLQEAKLNLSLDNIFIYTSR